MPDLDIPDDGFIKVRLAGVEQVVDVYQTFNHINGLRQRYTGATLTPDEAAEFNTGVVEHLLALGFTRVSHAAASRFVDAIYGAVENIRGNAGAGPTPGSPASTEPQPSSSPEESD